MNLGKVNAMVKIDRWTVAISRCYVFAKKLGDLRWIPPGIGIFLVLPVESKCFYQYKVQTVNGKCALPQWKCLALVEFIIDLGKFLSSGCFRWIPSSLISAAVFAHAASKGKCSKDWVAQPPHPLESILVEDMLRYRKSFLVFFC
ncbi:hypothetical protein QN277_008238 [Acacia crassicarpa]|uniref:Uncharacterized protein n=1 Tax=Acacia crassicarpa TaxID=499986 RepID=A0AAE1IR33_9FABA|nr:hypothetical protein QN277_008238 [Acacia crassicarpa]